MTKTQLTGKNVVITGAGSGIGRAAALQSAAKGAHLVLTDVNATGLDETIALVTAAGGGTVVHHEAFDVSDEDAVAAFAHRSLTTAEHVDVIMNVAGISTWGRIQDLTSAHWRRTIEIDLMGPIHVMSAFVPAMIEAGRGGHVVNVSSAAGLFGLPIHAPYSAAKFGLRGVSEVLRFDLEQHDIGVTTHAADFQKHAVSPDEAAAAMIRGMERGTYLVFTSRDIRVGMLAQRYVPFLHERAMRGLNRKVSRMIDKAATHAG